MIAADDDGSMMIWVASNSGDEAHFAILRLYKVANNIPADL